MKYKTRTMAKRWLAVILCLCMIFPSAVTLISAAEEPAYTGGPCEHHTEHTAECGYVEAVEGQLCPHVRDENCGYQEPTEEIPCAHVHDDSCGYQAAVAEIPCDKECIDEDGDGNIDHQEGCAYQPAMAEQPCTHTHDENCGYQAATDGSPCAHAHNEDCGYVEAVEGQPCTFVCEICSGEQEAQTPLSEDDIEITLNNPVGYVNQEYNLLEKATVTPEEDKDGNPIQLRITGLQANPENAAYEWSNPVLKVTSNENVAFTVTYEAYVELENTQEGQETEKVLATKQFTFTVFVSGEIGDRLDGDFAYISDAYLVEDEETESKLAIRTGTAPWDEDDSAGNDSGPLNNTVRSFDVVTYTAAFKTQVRSGSPYTAYKTGTVYYEFVVEGTGDLVRFETESMGWMTAKAEGKFDVTEETHDGKTYQVLRGSFLAEPSDGNPAAIGNSYQELNIALRVLAMTQGDTVKPQFTFWLEGNDVPEDGLVTGSGHSCSVHNEEEYKTIDAPDVSVTSAPRFNVRIVNGHQSVNQTVGTFDFSTGNELAQNRDAGTKEGRIQAFGAVIQIVGKSPQHGLRGCELPDGSPITFDLSLTSSYLSDEGETITPDDTYAPLLWSIDGNRSRNKNGNVTQTDERSLSMVAVPRVHYTPTNEVEDGQRWGCFAGGQWKGTQNGETIQVTISDYGVDLEQLPYNNIVEAPTTYQYYNPNNISGYWDIQTACFSAGEIWIVQPFYDSEGNYIADTYNSGTFQITLEDTNLQMAGESGTTLETVSDNSNQSVQDDDRAIQTSYLSKPGTIGLGIFYIPYTEQGDDGTLALTEGCRGNGKDWILRGNSLGISGYLGQNDAEGQARIIAADYLLKFDDSFFEPEKAISPSPNTAILYGAKPDKTGWNHQGKQPDEDGYDTEMMQATADDLIFFSSLEELKEQEYTCVAVLLESRRLFAAANDNSLARILGSSKDDSALDGNVFMITHSGVAWNRNDIKAAAAEWCNKEETDLTEEDYLSYVQNGFPSRAGKTTPLKYDSDYPKPSAVIDYDTSDALKNYTKSQYDENGYVTGTAGAGAGDSCLVVDYSTQITKSPNQPGTDEGGKKLTYDMDTSQREVDYVLYPTAIRSQGESTTEGTSTTTTVYIEDTLPAGLEYILNSAYYGGEYTSNGGGKAGTVTGGQELYPTVTENDDGTTTLLFTLKDVTITEEEVTTIDPIYYSCLIGTPGNEETDVVNQQQLLNSVKIWSDDEQIRDFVATNGNYAEQSIQISKNRGVSFSKTSDQKIVDVGDEMGFTIHHGNNSSNSMDVVDIDFLPHNEDGRGTQITGQVVVSELTVQSKELISGFKLYYTTDEEKRNTTAADYQAADFTAENGWTEMEIDPDTGAVELPDLTHVIVAVAAVGRLTPNSTLKMHISFEVPDGKPGEFLVNSFGSGDMESNARTYIVNRLLEGVVWLDTDKDGLRESGEALIDGVKVTLMQKGKDGNYTPYLLDGKAVSVETGKQINVLTGETSDNTRGTGAYGFHHLPQGDFAVQFESGETVKLGDYTATQENVGTNDTIDSDATAQEQDGKLVSARIEGIEMPEAKKITVQTYESRYHDLGLYASQINIPVEKVWDDNNNQDNKRPGSVTVALYANGNSTGQTLTLSEANGWKGTFENLDEFLDGEKIDYTVKEGPVNGYTTNITESPSGGFTITNSYTPETITISGSKTWDDKDNQDGKRPDSITIRLYADGEQVDDVTVTAEDDWKWSFTGLPKYADGKEILYTITEDTVLGYTSTVDGFNVTNTYTPEQTSVT
ncbi:MAG TPA: Cna B-type domain-containing protein, partial [Candidatus Fournierella merdigallinarum]|nr:Cna B-type domain-containing protein [Candidatus Fournierella merdigallinarum]